MIAIAGEFEIKVFGETDIEGPVRLFSMPECCRMSGFSRAASGFRLRDATTGSRRSIWPVSLESVSLRCVPSPVETSIATALTTSDRSRHHRQVRCGTRPWPQ